MIESIHPHRSFRAPRRKVLLKTQMRVGRHGAEVCIRDISSRGMLLMAQNPPPVGYRVELDVPGLSVAGNVLWSNDRRFGIKAQGPLDVEAIIGKLHGRAPRKAKIMPAADKRNRRPRSAGADPGLRSATNERIARSLQWGVVSVVGLGMAALIAVSLYYVLTQLTGGLAKAI